MAAFSDLIVTKKGQELIKKVDREHLVTRIFTKAAASSASYPEEALEALTALEQTEQCTDVVKMTVEDEKLTVETLFSNEGLSTAYELKTLGFYASDPDLGEILFAVSKETSGSCPVPAEKEASFSFYIRIVTTAEIQPAAVEYTENPCREAVNPELFINYSEGVYGVEVDFVNEIFTRVAGAAGKTAGAPFDEVRAFGGRRRCDLTDDGKVVAYYGDPGFSYTGRLMEDITIESGKNAGFYPAGTLVQVMVEQPKFYYKMVPLVLELFDEGYAQKGAHIRKARYYVADEPKPGFKLHPGFIYDGKENDYIYVSAFEGVIYDTSEQEYILDDAQIADFDEDVFSSIAYAKPASGFTQLLTCRNNRKLAQNRGPGWQQAYAGPASASQLLMLVEYAAFNMQNEVGSGVTYKDWGEGNCSEKTGATVDLGNATGTAENENGEFPVTYRGEENLWGNIWEWLDGVNGKNPEGFCEGQYGELFIADHDFMEGTGEPPYEDSGIHPCYSRGSYIKAYSYSEKYDWFFAPAEIGGTKDLPIGDFYYNSNPDWRLARLCGDWHAIEHSGPFYFDLFRELDFIQRNCGGRLTFTPSAAAK